MSAPRKSHTPEEIGQELLAGRTTPKKNRANWQRGLRKVLSVRLFGARVQRSQIFARVKGCGSPVATSKGTAFCEAPTEPTGENSPCPVDVMPCVISYWVLSGA